jgi:cell division septal protein FtsQ
VSRGYAKSRRLKRSGAARIRPFWILIALAALLSLSALAFAALWPGFDPSVVSVAGNRQVSTAEILQRAQIAPDRSIWLMNTRAIAARVRAIPYVSSVSVHRLPPASVAIAVSERVPFAILQTGGQSAVVDRDLRVLSLPGVPPPLPVLALKTKPKAALSAGDFVTGGDARALRDAYEMLASKGVVPATLALDRYGEIVAELPGGLRVLLGEPDGLEQKVTLTKAILAQVIGSRRSVSSIDLRAPSTPVIVYR